MEAVQVKCSVVRLSSYNSRIPSMAAAHPNDALFVRLKPRCSEGKPALSAHTSGHASPQRFHELCHLHEGSSSAECSAGL